MQRHFIGTCNITRIKSKLPNKEKGTQILTAMYIKILIPTTCRNAVYPSHTIIYP
jgi:hypothetical protein